MTVSKPNVSISIIRAEQLAAAVDHKVLIIGQQAADATATERTLVEGVSEDFAEIAALFGERSILAEMVREFKRINARSTVDVIPIDDNAGATDATATIGFSGTATASGRVFFEVGSGSRYRFAVDIVTGDTAATVAGKLNTAIQAIDTTPFTSVLSTADVDLTAVNGGTHANDWTLFVDGSVAGITISLTAWSGGATDPTLTSALFDVIAGKRYQTIVWPHVFSDTLIKTELAARFNVANRLLQGVAIICDVDSASNLETKAAALNSESVVLLASKAISSSVLTGSANREFADVLAAKFAAVRSARLTADQTLTPFLTTVASSDQFGGRALATLPYFNTVIPGLAIVRPADDWTPTEYESFEDSGVAVIGPNDAFNGMICGTVVTTSLTDGSGTPDTSYKFLNTVDAVNVVRDAYFTNIKARFGQSRLTSGDLVAGRAVENRESILAFFKQVYQSLAEDVIVADGSDAIAEFEASTVLSLDFAEGSISFAIAPTLVSGARAFTGTVQVKFGGS